MQPDAFSQPPFDRALELLSKAGLPPPEGVCGDPGWIKGLVEGLMHLMERAAAGHLVGVDGGFFVGPPFVGEVSADERAMLFVDAPGEPQEQAS
jgi:hypothetical protein